MCYSAFNMSLIDKFQELNVVDTDDLIRAVSALSRCSNCFVMSCCCLGSKRELTLILKTTGTTGVKQTNKWTIAQLAINPLFILGAFLRLSFFFLRVFTPINGIH